MSRSFATKNSFALWLIVPVKPFGEGKSRLASVLSPVLRAELSQSWLTHVLTTAAEWGAAEPSVTVPSATKRGHLAGIAVVSRDPAVLSLAATLGALPIFERDDSLNCALVQASQVVLAEGAEGVLMLPSDLPLLTADDLDALYNLALEGDSLVIAPSHTGGTNALLLRPPEVIAYAFGEDSFARHSAMAAAIGLPCHAYHSATIALDIDLPEDLAQVAG